MAYKCGSRFNWATVGKEKKTISLLILKEESNGGGQTDGYTILSGGYWRLTRSWPQICLEGRTIYGKSPCATTESLQSTRCLLADRHINFLKPQIKISPRNRDQGAATGGIRSNTCDQRDTNSRTTRLYRALCFSLVWQKKTSSRICKRMIHFQVVCRGYRG